MAAENTQAKLKEEREVCKQWLSKAVHTTEEMWMEILLPQGWCPYATGHHGLEGHSWVTDIHSGDFLPVFAYFLSFAEFFPSLEQTGKSCEDRSRKQHPPLHPMSLVPQECSAACFAMPKSMWEVTVQQGSRQDKVGTFLLGCGALRLSVTSDFLPHEL